MRAPIPASLALCGCLFFFAGCANKAPPPLYMWEAFPKMQYDALVQNSSASSDQILVMETQVAKARSLGAALPPGFRAHLGLLKLAAGNVDEARQLWLSEQLAFPESTPYISQLLKRLDAPAKKENPA